MSLQERRIKKDIKELYNHGYKVILANPNQIELYSHKIQRKIQINYSNDYPFKPPNVFINHIPYSNFIKLDPSFCLLYERIIHKCPCLTCSFFLGKDWGPVLNTFYIVKQIEDFSRNKEIVYLQFLNSIQQNFPWELITIFL